MSKYKRVLAMLGVMGILGALMALSTVAPTPAGADVRPTNTINITKIVSGIRPASLGTGDFWIDVNCGPAVDISNDGINNPVTFSQTATFNATGQVTTANGGVIVIDAAYTTCTVRETSPVGANVAPNSGTVQGSGSALTNVTLAPQTAVGNAFGDTNVVFPSLVQDPDGGNSASLIYINRFPGAEFNTVSVTKRTTGIVPPNAIFQINVRCDPPDVRPPTDFPAVFVGGGGTQDVQIPKDCTGIEVREVVAQGAPDSFDINGVVGANPYLGVAFPVGSSGRTFNVVVTNNYGGLTNKITVRKTVVGTPPPGVTFSGSTTCTDNGPGPDVTRNWAFGSSGGSIVLEFPASTGQATQLEACVTTENLQANAADEPQQRFFNNLFPILSGVSLANNTTQSQIGWSNSDGNNTATVEVVNRYLAGPFHTITVNKATVGTVPAGTNFLVRINCTYDVDGAGPLGNIFFMAFGNGLPATQSFGTVMNLGSCQVEETFSGGAASRTFASGPASTGTVLQVFQDPNGSVLVDWLQATTPENAQVNITNRFSTKAHPDNVLRIKKQLRGRVPAGASFTIRVNCAGGGITDTRTLNFTTNSFQEISVPANRSDCRVQETVNGGAQSVSYFASSATADATEGPNSARVDFGTVTGGQRGKVIVRNQFPGTCPRPGPKFC